MRGFSLLDILLSLAALAFGSTAGISWFFGRANVTLENAAVLLAQDLRAAQNRAAFAGRATHVVFLNDGDGYVVTNDDSQQIQDPRDGYEMGFERRYSIDGVFRGVHVQTVRLGTDRTLVFDRNGRATEDGLIELTYEGERRVLVIEQESGRFVLEGSSSGWTDIGY